MDQALRWLIRHPAWVLAATAVITLLAVTVLVEPHPLRLRLAVDPALQHLLPRDDASVQITQRLQRQFGATEEVLLAVRLPSVFTAEGLAAIEQVNRRLRTVEGVRNVTSLATAPNLLADDETLDVSSFTRQAEDDPASIARMPAQVAANPLYAGTLVDGEARTAAFLIALEGVDVERFRKAGLAEALREAATVPGVEAVWLTGSIVVEAATNDALLRTLARTVPLIVLIVLVVLTVAFRCFKTTLAAAACIGLGLLWTMALLVLAGQSLNMVSIITPPLILTLGLSYAVHLLADFFGPEGAQSAPEARLESLRRAAQPLLLCGITTAAGLLALALSPLPAVRQFAALSAVGVLITITLIIGVLPAMLAWLRCGPAADHGEDTRLQRLAARLARFATQRRALILGVAAALLVVFAGFASRIQSGAEYIRNFPAEAPARADFEALNQIFGGATFVTVLVESHVNDALTQPELIREIDALQRWLREQPEVGSALSYVDHLKVLHQSLNGGDPAAFRIPDTAAAVKQILVFGSSEALKGAIDPTHRSARIAVRLNVDDSRAIAAFVQRAEERLGALPPPLVASLAGTPVMATRTVEALASGQWQSIGAALFAIWGLMALLFNSARAAALALLPNALVILGYFGLLGATGVGLNPTTGLVACIVLGVAVDDTIQFLARFNRDARATGSEERAVGSALAHVLRPVTLTSVALVAGFLAFTTSELTNHVQFGVLAAATLAFAWLTDLTVTPALGSKLRIVTLWDLLRLDLGQNPQHTIPLFAGLSLREARLFALMARVERLQKGERLIEEGEIARDMFVIVDGQLEAWVEREGQRKTLATMTRGAVVGEAGYFGQRRTAHVDAVTPARVLRFNGQDLERLRERYPRIAAVLFRNLNRIQAERIARMTALVR